MISTTKLQRHAKVLAIITACLFGATPAAAANLSKLGIAKPASTASTTPKPAAKPGAKLGPKTAAAPAKPLVASPASAKPGNKVAAAPAATKPATKVTAKTATPAAKPQATPVPTAKPSPFGTMGLAAKAMPPPKTSPKATVTPKAKAVWTPSAKSKSKPTFTGNKPGKTFKNKSAKSKNSVKAAAAKTPVKNSKTTPKTVEAQPVGHEPLDAKVEATKKHVKAAKKLKPVETADEEFGSEVEQQEANDSSAGPWLFVLVLALVGALGGLLYLKKKRETAGNSNEFDEASSPETGFSSNISSLDMDEKPGETKVPKTGNGRQGPGSPHTGRSA